MGVLGSTLQPRLCTPEAPAQVPCKCLANPGQDGHVPLAVALLLLYSFSLGC